MKRIIRVGDRTDHGGTVLEGFPEWVVDGKAASGVGHRGTCPKCKKEFVIVEGAQTVIVFGRAVALEGMMTSCGAVLIASQDMATVDVYSAAAAGSSAAISGAYAAMPQRAQARQLTAAERAQERLERAEQRQADRRAENEQYLLNPNVKALLDTIAWAEGGEYNFKYGANPGNAPRWRFDDYSTHPGVGLGGRMTAAGRYQITQPSWHQNGAIMQGITDFSPHSQDLMAVELIRSNHVLDRLIAGDLPGTLDKCSFTWSSLPRGPGLPNRYPGQPYKHYEDVLHTFISKGGTVSQ
ncbi:PAAR domain-containing protein [Amantichitinum ursilacus]|uniref:PAAR motif protein n=1 Tax=Amantichitinum ursilacus TaxID=857265 RepID=A0A0N0XK32_9NEIS|nr:PAAR domain-containing protein [Amantichitinum ursilacus]KPC53848.1 hypothetical protein WG78_06985 [Amantichitinum ursilacus]